MQSPLGLYLHVPYCRHRCSYCDFYSLTGGEDASFRQVAARLRDEIREAAQFWRAEVSDAKLASLFFGGGTPSLLPTDELTSLYQTIEREFGWEPDAEITTEANPENVTDAWAQHLVQHTPVNRVSLGAQSFDERHLQTLERLARPEHVRSAVRTLQQVGIRRLNVDLIFGIPGQTVEEAERDVDEAAALGIEHVSSYQLTLQPGHKLYSRLPSSDESAEFYEAVVRRLAHHGFARYEISNFSKPNAQCRHNVGYWRGGSWLGLGPSASSRFTRDGVYWHRKAPSDLARWIALPFADTKYEALSPWQTALETLSVALRTPGGIDAEKFLADSGVDLFARAEKFRILGPFARREGSHLVLSDRGVLLTDAIVEKLAPTQNALAP